MGANLGKLMSLKVLNFGLNFVRNKIKFSKPNRKHFSAQAKKPKLPPAIL